MSIELENKQKSYSFVGNNIISTELKGPILSKLKCPGLFHDNRGLGDM